MSTSSEFERLFSAAAPWIMGVLNITPDSFSDGGRFVEPGSAREEILRMANSGAHIIDIGGEATGPNSAAISAALEIDRIAPLLTDLPSGPLISIDTYKAETARFALERGARMINDVSALRADAELSAVVREHGAFVVLMFAKGSGPLPHANDEDAHFEDVVVDVGNFLRRRIDFALRCGIREDRILVDPGMGKFLSNNADDSWKLLARLDELTNTVRPFPVLVGVSRKGFLGGKLSERDPISQLTAIAAVKKGAQIIRTHRPEMAREFFGTWKRVSGF